MTDGLHISRGSLPGWLSSAALVLGVVGYFFYERASDEKWMALESKSFEGIERRLDTIEDRLAQVRAAVYIHQGEHAVCHRQSNNEH